MTVVWERDVDPAEATGLWRKLGVWFGIPAVVALLLALVLGGVGAFLGVLILVVLVGLLGVSYVFFQNLGKKAWPTVSLENGELCWAKRRFPVADIARWSTFMSAAEITVGLSPSGGGFQSATGSADMGVLRLRRPDGKEEEWKWAHLTPEELETLKAALVPHIPAPWEQVGGWYSR